MATIREPRSFAIRVGRDKTRQARWVLAGCRTSAFAKVRDETGTTEDLYLLDERDGSRRRETEAQ